MIYCIKTIIFLSFLLSLIACGKTEIIGGIPKYALIAHAAGGIDGKLYTNSLDALELHYSKGTRVFEIDFNYLEKENRLAIFYNELELKEMLGLSDINEITYDKISNIKAYGKYTLLTPIMLMQYMSRHADMILITDHKLPNGNKNLEIKFWNSLLEIAKDVDADILNRIYPQVYSISDLEFIKSIYNFKQIYLTLYKQPSKSFLDKETIEQHIEAFKSNKYLNLVTKNSLYYAKLIKVARKLDRAVIFHSNVNSIQELKKSYFKGATNVMTDFIYQNEVVSMKKNIFPYYIFFGFVNHKNVMMLEKLRKKLRS